MNKIPHIILIFKNLMNGYGQFINKSLFRSKLAKGIALFFVLNLLSIAGWAQAASWNYLTQTGTLGTTYSWIDCSGGTNIVSGDDSQASFLWPFDFAFYDNIYTTANMFSVATNGFIRLDGTASTSYTAASNYTLSSTSTELGQIIALAVYDGKVGDNGGWVRSVVTGSAPNRIMTIEYNNLEIDYNDGRYTDVQVSFYETSYKIVIKLGADNIYKNGVDIGIHSGVDNYFDKWQEVYSGTNNTWIEYTPVAPPDPPAPPVASWNYGFSSGNLGTTYDWIDCSSGNFVLSGDDTQAQINWPFDFNYYDNTYTTSDRLSVCSNGFIRFDGAATTNYSAASAYDLTSTATNLGQIIAIALYDGNVSASPWVRSLVTGTAPNRVFTIEYSNYEIDYNDGLYANAQVSFYESINKIVLKLGTDNINKAGVDMGLHSGVDTYFNKWQEVLSGTNNTWIEYLPPYVEVNATIGTSSASYFTLKSAFDKINDGTHQGEITIKINHSTTETATAALNASGAGSANYSSVNMYPTETGLSISGDLAAPLINLNGADNVTIDGRVNATGSTADLMIINTMVSGTSNTSTLRFINSATNNTIQYCTVKGGATGPYTALFLFAGAWKGSGNSNNLIENCNLTGLSASARPYAVVYSYGTAGRENSNNSITNNNIYDFFEANATSYGIYIYQYSTDWTISENSFFETTDFEPTASRSYYAIRVYNGLGNNFSITNNFIGGRAASCGGESWSMNTLMSSRFYAIHLDVGTDTPSSVQGNTIRNFDITSSNSIPWMGIDANSGDVNIGTVSGNTIGSATGNNSVLLTKSNANIASKSYGIYVNSSDTVVISNNTIGSVTTQSTNLYAHSFYGVYKVGNKSGSLVVSNNLIGSLTSSNSIQASTSSTSGSAQDVYGIMSSASGTTVITSNTVANLSNAYAYQWANKGQVAGIYTDQGINTIQNNTIGDLSCTSASNSTVGNAAVIGIAQQSTTGNQNINGNTVYGLNSTYTDGQPVNVMGIYYYGDTSGTNEISGNFIHSLNASSASASLTGIKVYAGTTTIANNIINLGVGVSTGITINGLYENGNAGNDNSLWFNAVYIGGTASGTTASTYALYSATDNNGRDFRNNILSNARTGGTTGNHYAIRIGGMTNVTIDYNDYFISGSPSILGRIGSTDYATFTDWQTATSQDANSLNIDPQFATAGGTDALDYITSASLPGVTIAGITTDYDGVTRYEPPKMGALEVSPTFTWQGNTSTDFATASNWVNGAVPPNGADIEFAASPTNDCYLDQARTLNNITNTSDKKFDVNGNQLTITGNILSATVNQLDASAASSVVIFAGNAPQNIPSDVFVSNTIDALTLNNEHGLTQNGDLIIPTTFTLTSGDYSIGSNTLTINGAISTTSGSLTGGSTSNIVIGGSGSNTTLPGVALSNLTLNRSNGITLGGIVSIEGTLTLTSGTLTLGPDTLTISGNSPIRTSGNIDAGNESSTLKFSNSSAITLAASLFTGDINNLTINGAGITAGGDMTINGVLNLQSTNPSAAKGSLDMGAYTLNMESASTTTGIGDVTGIVRREHTFVQNVEYSFGSQYTTFTFNDANLKPTWISLEISIGSVATWSPWDPSPDGKVKRLYKVASSANASTSAATIDMRYLLSELDATYNDESRLVFWHKFTNYGGGAPHEHGKSTQDFTNHFIGVTGLILGAATTSNLDDSQVTMAYAVSEKNTWKGEVSGHETEWEQAQNWTAGHVPLSTEEVLIPGGLDYYPSLTASSNAVANTIEIHTGASITANSYDITVSGAGGAWINNGTFNAGTGKVLFDHGVLAETVTVSGITDFYDIEVAANTTMQPVAGCILRIAGTGSADMTSVIDFSTINNTVEWNGADQTIVNPNGISGNSGYFKLILSGSGTKTMPTTAMNIADELKLDGTVTVTAQAALTIGVEFEILPDATFNTGNFDHTVGGPFDNRGTFIASSGTKITLNGTAVQQIYGGSPTTFEKLSINNAAGIDIFTDITVNDELTLTSGNLNVLNTTLTINGAITKTSGFINTATQSSLTFGGTAALVLATDLFASTPQINNLTINRTGGVEFSSNITVNDTLNLVSANPSSTIGTLDMGTDTLNMGENAITIGNGDLTGIVKREHTFNVNMEYSFGSQYTTFTFNDDNLKPTWISLKIAIGSVATWSPWTPSPNGKVKRLYQVASSENASTSAASINMRYLLSELDATYNDESKLVFWHKFTNFASGEPHEHGKSTQDFTNHFIGVTGLILGAATTSNIDDSQVTMAYAVSEKNTWKGEVSGHETEWEQAQNWTAGNVPLSTEEVLIPGGLTYYPSLTASSNAVAKTIEIETGASITANSYDITVSGAGGAWINNGTFNAGTGKVLFDHGVIGEIATVAGITNFYDIEVAANTTMQPVAGCILRIAGTGSADITSVIDFSTINNTVEWNGADQTIVNPNGIGSNSGYYNLIISGSGTKTMPSSAMTIHGNFALSGTASATAADSIIVIGNTTIDNGATFTTGSHDHFLGGNFENNGTFTPTSGGTITFNGTSAQTISGSSTTTFDGLSVSNLHGVSLSSDVTVNNVLSFLDGNLSVVSNTLGINGTIYNPGGNIVVSSLSSLAFGGTSAITLNNNLFNGNPVINNLTINRSGGVTLGNESMTVDGTLTLTSGTLAIAANTLTLTGNSPVRTSGNIDASHASATFAFENPAAITLPSSLFSGNVNNITINGAGGITAGGDFTLDGILNLQSANPSSVKGSLHMDSYTLTMGATSTTIGQGDVTGIIKRTSIAPNTTYTLGNRYTTIYFPNVGTLPTEMSLKVTLGNAPSWRTGAIERVYDFIQTGGSETEAVLQSHYLDSELNGNDEAKLVQWMHIYASSLTIEYGRSDYNVNENWVSVSHVNVGVFSSVFGEKELVVDEYEALNLTWNGSTSTSWVTATNWTPQGAPSDETVVTIPDAATTTYDPSIPETAICGKVIIESGGIFNSVDDGQLTVKGANGAWVNNGTFAPGTGTVIFAHGIETDTVTIAGTNSFYNLTVTDKTRFQPDTNSIINIEGAFSANTSNCILDFSSNPNTVGYNGSKDQSVVNPGGIYGYHNLNFSGGGTKILPESSLMIIGDLSIDAAISATGNTIRMAGTNAQNLGGTTDATLNNLTIDNTIGVVLTNTALTTVSGNLLINTGKIFEIAAAQKLSVTGTITNNGGSSGFILNSDATGTATLFHNTDDVPATVQRYITGNAEDWHFLSTPVSNQPISGSWLPSGTYGNGTGYDLYLWNEPNSCWIYYLDVTSTINWSTVHPETDFVTGRGYLYSVQAANPTKEFAGNLNNGSLSFGLTFSSSDLTLKGFNLVGNPYPSSIDWSAASGWNRTNLDVAGGGYNMWIWNPAASNYGVYNSADGDGVGTNSVTQFVAPMQGFFVQAESAGSLSMNNNVRVNEGADNWFKSSKYDGGINENVAITVTSEKGNGFDEIQLRFGNSENENGATKLFSRVATAPSLYMVSAGNYLSVRYLTNTEDNPVVPMSFKPGANGNFTLSCNFDHSGFETVMLEDRKEQSFHDMKVNSSYGFRSSKSDAANRFVLYFGAVGTNPENIFPAKIYTDGYYLIIDLTLVINETKILVYDIMGRQLLHQKLEGETIHKLNINTVSHILIVSLKNPAGGLNQKVFWNGNR